MLRAHWEYQISIVVIVVRHVEACSRTLMNPLYLATVPCQDHDMIRRLDRYEYNVGPLMSSPPVPTPPRQAPSAPRVELCNTTASSHTNGANLLPIPNEYLRPSPGIPDSRNILGRMWFPNGSPNSLLAWRPRRRHSR